MVILRQTYGKGPIRQRERKPAATTWATMTFVTPVVGQWLVREMALLKLKKKNPVTNLTSPMTFKILRNAVSKVMHFNLRPDTMMLFGINYNL